jgi:anti-sigma regulatory factor (Ser/Thr protein kinase)
MPYYGCSACGLTSYSASPTATVCPTCSTSMPGHAKLHLVPGSTPELSRTFAAHPMAADEARRVVAGLPVPERTRDELTVLVSELVTNAELHAGVSGGDEINLHLTTTPGQVRVEVHHSGRGFTPRPGEQQATGGFDFTIVADLSDAWGFACDPSGCTAWCAVRVPEASAAAARAPSELPVGHTVAQ